MAGETATPISYQSPLPGIADILKLLGGQKTSESGSVSSGGTSVSTTKGDTGDLESVFSKQMDPQALQSLVESLFAQGAAKVPGLTNQYANATGTRVSNNSMLSSSLAELNQSIASTLGAAIVQQQKDASTTAGAIANANKTTTGATADQKSTTATTTVKTPNAAAAGMGSALVGFGLNRVGKWLDKPETPVDVAGGLPSSTAYGNPDTAPFAPDAGVSFAAPAINDVAAPNLGVSDFGQGSSDAGLTLNGADFGLDLSNPLDSIDWSSGANLADAGSAAIDAGSAIDFSDLPSAGTDLGNALDWLPFKDGGRIGAASQPLKMTNQIVLKAHPDTKKPDMPQETLLDENDVVPLKMANGGRVGKPMMYPKGAGYADGGQVRQRFTIDGATGKVVPANRNMNYMGEQQDPATRDAYNTRRRPIEDQENQPKTNTSGGSSAKINLGGSGATAGGGENGIGFGTDLNPASSSTSSMSTSTGLSFGLSVAGLAQAFASANPLGIALAIGKLGYAAYNASNSMDSGAVGAGGGMGPGSDASNPDSISSGAGQSHAELSFDPSDPATPVEVAPPDTAPATPELSPADPSDDGPPGGGMSDSGSGGTETGTGPGEVGVGGDGAEPGAPGFQKGGKIKGPGTPTSDSIPILASKDEYMLPADVAQYIGYANLDALVAHLHTPAADQGN